MEISEDFKSNGYVHVQKFVSKDFCSYLADQLKKEIDQFGWNDGQCPKSKSIRDSQTFDSLLEKLLPDVEDITGLKLYPTYAYARLYMPGEELKSHKDRESCEISVTLTLGFDGSPWSFFLSKEDSTATEIVMNVGDAVVYKGRELNHWRNKYEDGKWQAQVFLHYVDADGPYAEWKYDKRKSLSEPDKSEENNDLTFWYYTDVLTSQDCDSIITALSNVELEKAAIGDGNKLVVDESIRKVDKIVLPTYKGVGAILTAVGINANRQRWNFDISGSNQCEFLHYPAGGGRYKGHIDTFLTNESENMINCRKLTVLAFLNDDFKGGKFFLQVGHERFYPPQAKGTVLVFPSFVYHGVEDVEEGNRYSAVCWLVGPWFK